MLVLIPKPHVAQSWPVAAPYLAKAVKAGSLSLFHLEEWLGDCINGARQLWLVWIDDTCQGAVVTSLCETPTGKMCIIDGFAAKPKSNWLPLLNVIEAWATAQHCVRVRVYGRVGWADKLKDYALRGVILDRDL